MIEKDVFKDYDFSKDATKPAMAERQRELPTEPQKQAESYGVNKPTRVTIELKIK